MAKKVKNMRNIKTPNRVIYLLVFVFIYPLLKLFFSLKIYRREFKRPVGSFVLVANHQSFLDFLLVMLSIYPVLLNAVTAQKFFYYSPLHKFLPLMGCIPKNLFDTDPRSIIGMMSVIKQGGQVLIFPEGRTSTDGVFCGIHKHTGKLLKKLNVPVVACRVEGSYICMPFWRKKFKFGRVSVHIENLYTAEQMQGMTPEEINRGVCDALNEVFSSEQRARTCSNARLTRGLENILYLCPICGSEFKLSTDTDCKKGFLPLVSARDIRNGKMIYCVDCGFAAKLDRYGRFDCIIKESAKIPTTIHEWFTMQVENETKKMSKDMLFTRKVTLRMPNDPGGGLRHCGHGDILLSAVGWRYIGDVDGEPNDLFFPIATVPAVPFDPNDNFQIYYGGKFYVFTPENPVECVKYAILGEAAHISFAEDVQISGFRAYK